MVDAAGCHLWLLILWAVICLFPIYWTLTTSFKMAPDVMKGHMIPWVDFRRHGWAGDPSAFRPTRSWR
jgi:ABC-type glycerol-3-phosphate transport system permease component